VRHIAVLDAPSNLGLRPPTATSVPGCAKAPGALRDHGLLTRLDARDAGCLTPPRYDAGDWRPGDGVAHANQIADYSRRLADRIGAILDAGEFPVILGGDCSILLGSGLAMHRLGEAVGGHIGLVFVDGHSDFRHPGNASYVGAAAGEDLALVTGRGQPDLASIEGRRPYFRDIDVVVMGIRAQDEYRLDLQAAGIVTRPVPALRAEGAARSAQWARDQLADCAGYWVHVDVDVLDPAVMPAVDAPSPGGIAFPELELLLAGLVESPHCLGVELTVFDPDYDPDGEYAAEITSTVSAGLAPAKTVALRPDLAAARQDLDRNDEATRQHRRASAAAQSVPLAAAAASGNPGTPGEAALPATTLLAVEEGADLPPSGGTAPDPADTDQDATFDPSPFVPPDPEPALSDPAESELGVSDAATSARADSEPAFSDPAESELADSELAVSDGAGSGLADSELGVSGLPASDSAAVDLPDSELDVSGAVASDRSALGPADLEPGFSEAAASGPAESELGVSEDAVSDSSVSELPGDGPTTSKSDLSGSSASDEAGSTVGGSDSSASKRGASGGTASGAASGWAAFDRATSLGSASRRSAASRSAPDSPAIGRSELEAPAIGPFAPDSSAVGRSAPDSSAVGGPTADPFAAGWPTAERSVTDRASGDRSATDRATLDPFASGSVGSDPFTAGGSKLDRSIAGAATPGQSIAWDVESGRSAADGVTSDPPTAGGDAPDRSTDGGVGSGLSVSDGTASDRFDEGGLAAGDTEDAPRDSEVDGAARYPEINGAARDPEAGDIARAPNAGDIARAPEVGDAALDLQAGDAARASEVGDAARDLEAGDAAHDSGVGDAARDLEAGDAGRDSGVGDAARNFEAGDAGRDSGVGDPARRAVSGGLDALDAGTGQVGGPDAGEKPVGAETGLLGERDVEAAEHDGAGAVVERSDQGLPADELGPDEPEPDQPGRSAGRSGWGGSSDDSRRRDLLGRSRLGPRNGGGDVAGSGARMLPRPLGSAPLLDSEPLPATRPGMLRPRRTEPLDDDASHESEGFSLPVQRPAFDAGSGEPADIA
jgi:arginase family enzyme